MLHAPSSISRSATSALSALTAEPKRSIPRPSYGASRRDALECKKGKAAHTPYTSFSVQCVVRGKGITWAESKLRIGVPKRAI